MMKYLFGLIAGVCLLFATVGCEDIGVQPVDSGRLAWQYSGKHVVAFTIEGCRQCKADKPDLAQLQAAGVDVINVDANEHPELCREYKIPDRYPCYMVIEDGVVQYKVFTIANLLMVLKILLWIAGIVLL